MATIAKISNGASAASALNYALGKDKPMHEKTETWLKEHNLTRPLELTGCRAVAVGGTNGIDPFIAKEQFETIRELYDQKKEKNQVLRITQSFALDELHPTNTLDWQKANELGVELAEKLYPQHQSAVYTHLDGKNHVLHNHIIVNKVNLETGNKLREKPGESVEKARECNDQIARREQWHVLEKPQERFSDTEKELTVKNKYSYMDDLRNRINQVMQDVSVSSYEGFKTSLSDNGVDVSERGQTLSYAFLDINNKQRRAREQRLGTDFGKETILNELENRARTRQDRQFEPREPETFELEQTAQRRKHEVVSIEQESEPRKSGIGRRESTINRIIERINQFREQLPEITQRVKTTLSKVKDKILDDFERRFSKDMKNHDQKQREETFRNKQKEREEPKKQKRQNHDRGMGL